VLIVLIVLIRGLKALVDTLLPSTTLIDNRIAYF